jgi:Flp pilus assembly protein TadG
MSNIIKFINPNKKGQSIVEFAIVFTFVLFPLILGMLEFGWYFNGLLTINSAAREGARVAIVYNSASDAQASVEAAVKSSLDISSFDYDHVDISLPMDTGDNSDRVKVNVYAKFKPLVGLYIDRPTSGALTISSSAIMRLE